MEMTGKFGEAIIGPNFKISVVDYGDLKHHNKNCTAYINELIFIKCENGWVSIG